MNRAEGLVQSLRDALRAARHSAADSALEHLRDKGLAHDHVRIVGSGLLARVPKQSQMDLGAHDNLAYQRACFERAAASAHTPALRGWLMPSFHLPRGALLVDEIRGRPAQLPTDLDAIATALAALHALPLPGEPAPLRHAHDPLRDLCDEIATQMAHLPAASVPTSVEDGIQSEWRSVLQRLDSPERPPRCLVAFDAHPGNFMVQADARAMLVDLEKCRYAYPGLDLAHATLYTSTTWDLDTQAELAVDQVARFYGTWARAAGPVASAALAWHLPLRRAMWLWSVSWCAKWRASSGAAPRHRPDGEDWSSGHSEAALVAHVQERVDHYLSPAAVSRVRDEFAALEHLWRS
ncbi:phosphotransferase [Hydrogenophaga sp.]|uniref:phosphotransferase n=1 Tax=Hydrogenophaga sp. TaxID=1904254 RepID=UPI003F70B329